MYTHLIYHVGNLLRILFVLMCLATKIAIPQDSWGSFVDSFYDTGSRR